MKIILCLSAAVYDGQTGDSSRRSLDGLPLATKDVQEAMASFERTASDCGSWRQSKCNALEAGVLTALKGVKVKPALDAEL